MNVTRGIRVLLLLTVSMLAHGQELPSLNTDSICVIKLKEQFELGILEGKHCHGYQNSSLNYYPAAAEFIENIRWVLPGQAQTGSNIFLATDPQVNDESPIERICLSLSGDNKFFIGKESSSGQCRNSAVTSDYYALAELKEMNQTLSGYQLMLAPATSPGVGTYIATGGVIIVVSMVASQAMHEVTGVSAVSIPFIIYNAFNMLRTPEYRRGIYDSLASSGNRLFSFGRTLGQGVNHVLHGRVRITIN